jgi:hypothetical protein
MVLLAELLPIEGKNVNLFLCLTNYTLLHEGIWECGYIDPHFLTLPLAGGGQLHAHGERTPSTHCIGGWVNPRAGLDYMEKILDLTRTQNSESVVIQP